MTKNKYLLSGVLLLFVFTMILFSLADIALSRALSGRFPWFTYFFELTGLIPALLLAFVCPLIVFFTRTKREFPSSILSGFVLFPISGTACFILVYQTIFYIIRENEALMDKLLPFVFLVFFSTFLLTVFIIGRRPEEKLVKYRSFALIGTAAVTTTMLSVEILKNIFGRVRPRDLQEGIIHFTAWFRINGFTGNKSFPSAHSAYSFSSVLYSLLGRNRKERILLMIAGILWGVAVALSRVFLGAHFPSDVTIGAFIALLSSYLYSIYIPGRIKHV